MNLFLSFLLLLLPSSLSFSRSSHTFSRSSSSSSSPLHSTKTPTQYELGFKNSRLSKQFLKNKESNSAAFIGFITAGYPTPDDTVSLMLAMQSGGASVIELGVPYSDPQADGATIQKTNQIAIANGVDSISHCLAFVKEARDQGLTIPVVLMGYYNPFYQFGIPELVASSASAGVDGFIVVDLPPEESFSFVSLCNDHELSYIPLISPVSTDERIKTIIENASSFIYCVSVTGVTGSGGALPSDLKDFVARIRSQTDLPLAVGFGVVTPDQVKEVSNIGDAVVVGSAILNSIDLSEAATPAQKSKALEVFVKNLVAGTKQSSPLNQATRIGTIPSPPKLQATASMFGEFGGQFIPETLSEAFREIDEQYNIIKDDPEFISEVARYRKDFVGGPTSLHFAPRLTEYAGGANIYLKREDLAHTGAHKINNAIGQALLAIRLGKKRIIAETGAGQHGVATATVCAMLGLECVVYMGAVDCERQKLNVFRMKTLGATVIPVETGQKTLKDAINEAMRDWVTNVRTTHYLIGSAVGPHPFPTIVRDFQSVIGKEIKSQMLEVTGRLPDAVVACVGGGSNAIGSFHTFIPDSEVELYGAEAAGYGLSVDEGHCATLTVGTKGVLQGAMTYIIQSPSGQSCLSHSISAGLDYVGVGPEHAHLKATKRASYMAVDDKQAMEGFDLLCKYEGIIPALETSHAVYLAVEKLAKKLGKGKNIVINLSGRGDKDMPQIAKLRGVDV